MRTNTWRSAHGLRNYSARSGKLCAMDLQSDQKMDQCHAFVHARWSCTKRYYMVAAVHRMVQRHGANVAQFKDKDFW
jgi:hypothetical protein